MDDIREVVKYERMLGESAGKFRCADKSFPGLEIEYKTFLNDVGKILERIGAVLMCYRYASPEKQFKMRVGVHNLRIFVDKQIDELSKEIKND